MKIYLCRSSGRKRKMIDHKQAESIVKDIEELLKNVNLPVRGLFFCPACIDIKE